MEACAGDEGIWKGRGSQNYCVQFRGEESRTAGDEENIRAE